jgi:hypothetical protein
MYLFHSPSSKLDQAVKFQTFLLEVSDLNLGKIPGYSDGEL